jgi:multidrug transporter EmrE-like cation transporter
MSQYLPLVYGSYLATVDVFALGILKFINLGKLSKSYLTIPTILYAIQPHVFLAAMKYENMTVMNLLWDVISDVLVTASGLFFFKETVTPIKLMGVAFAFMAIILLSWPDGSDNKI